MSDKDAEEFLAGTAAAVADAHNQDLYFLSGPVDREALDEICQCWFSQRLDRPNVGLVLTTTGGDPDAAYLIARFLRRHYDYLRVYVFGYCKSAGTLLALGANQLVVGDRGELGPLDIQLAKDDELFRQSSGLDIFQALSTLAAMSQRAFDLHFMHLQKRSAGTITSRTAADIATALVNGNFSPIAGQLDPVKLGEVQRAVNIALEYGVRLGANKDLVQSLVTGYPSHSFVIDVDEALAIFPNARLPEAAEFGLEFALENESGCLHYPHSEKRTCRRISPERTDDDAQSDTGVSTESGNGAALEIAGGAMGAGDGHAGVDGNAPEAAADLTVQ